MPWFPCEDDNSPWMMTRGSTVASGTAARAFATTS
jgi:hypothetical protein